jgi:hypothetical protein
VVSIAKKPESYMGVQHWPAAILTETVVYRLSLPKFAECGCYVSGKGALDLWPVLRAGLPNQDEAARAARIEVMTPC